MLRSLIFILISLGIANFPLNAQDSSGFVDDILVVPSSCGGPTGSIDLVTDDIGINIEWSNGDTLNPIENLYPGLYSATITDQVDGCNEVINVNVPNANCRFRLVFQEAGPSYFQIRVIFILNQQVVPNDFLVFEWYYGGNVYNTATLLVPYYPSPQVALTVRLSTEYGEIPCCTFHRRIKFPKGFTVKKPPVYVYNTTFKSTEAEMQVPGRVELLVYGDGTCEGVTDLRGFIIDDNNGELIVANPDSSNIAPSHINVSSGYLKFSDHANWSKVPNGSLITIYEKNHTLNEELISINDPTDVDENFVYILNEQDQTYLTAHSGQWEADSAILRYDINIDNTINGWDLIKADGYAEGVQIRYPNGDYCHGISFGKNEFTLEDYTFPLYLSSTPHPYGRIHMDNLSHYLPEHFTISEIEGGFNVGEILEESTLLDTILALRNCQNRSHLRNDVLETSDNVKEQTKTINIYPNPFEKIFNIEFTCPQEGEVTLNVLNTIGQVLKIEKLSCSLKKNTYSFKLTENDNDGLYLLRFDFPDNSSVTKKIIMMNP